MISNNNIAYFVVDCVLVAETNFLFLHSSTFNS